VSKRNVRRVPYTLDAGGVESLSAAEIAAILRGADDMIGRGGRTQLSKLLKGSRDANLLEHGLHRNPSYGFYRDLPLDEIVHRIDWMIEREYLGIEYDYRLPVLVFTDIGWAIEMATMAAELLDGFEARLAAGPPYDLSHLKDRNRGMIFLLLDTVAASGRTDFIPLLQAWAEIDYAKVRKKIAGVIGALREGENTTRETT
jgi:hypothetical protein